MDRQTLIDAVREGETTDAGGMTTTQDVTDVVSESYWTVEEELRTLRREGAVESKIFGNQRVWVVPDNSRDQTSTAHMPTTTREPVTD
ncbi:MAG: hypothetical protein J07HX64_01051 [halophilic archaeon J07HX64]|nr:MAG: hypothetical protein J07HX64_01051 [halophilic archaeon J07HX64]